MRRIMKVLRDKFVVTKRVSAVRRQSPHVIKLVNASTIVPILELKAIISFCITTMYMDVIFIYVKYYVVHESRVLYEIRIYTYIYVYVYRTRIFFSKYAHARARAYEIDFLICKFTAYVLNTWKINKTRYNVRTAFRAFQTTPHARFITNFIIAEQRLRAKCFHLIFRHVHRYIDIYLNILIIPAV